MATKYQTHSTLFGNFPNNPEEVPNMLRMCYEAVPNMIFVKSRCLITLVMENGWKPGESRDKYNPLIFNQLLMVEFNGIWVQIDQLNAKSVYEGYVKAITVLFENSIYGMNMA